MNIAKPLAPSTTKKEFLLRLGLAEGEVASEKVHKKMMEEARIGRDHLSYDRESIAPHNRNDPEVTQPYSWSQIMETAKHQQVLAIYHSASPETRPLYDRGHYIDGVNNEENWVISWCLWHAFRSFRHRPAVEALPDSADHRENMSSSSSSGQVSQRQSVPYTPPTTSGRSQTAGQDLAQSQPSGRMSGYYDPVRDI